MVSAIVFNDEKVPCKDYHRVRMPEMIPTNRKAPIGYNIWKPPVCLVKLASGLILVAMITLLVVCTYQRFNRSMQTMRDEQMFNDFILQYDRRYPSLEEFEFRFKVFVQNVREFEAEEKKHLGLDLDVNEFSDWTDEELKLMIIDETEVQFEGLAVRYDENVLEDGVKRPASIDWRTENKLTAVKNQGQCGSCWAFATVAAVEAQHAIKKGKLVSLSEQEMVDCDDRNNGCSGGYRPYAMRFVKENGLETDQQYPYSAMKHETCSLRTNDTRVFIDDYRMLSTNEEDIADWVGTKGPVTFGMNVVKAMYSYRGGVFAPTVEDCAEKTMGAHALTIVGYGGEGTSAYWIVKNSWGSTWGTSGYFRLARGVNSCGMANTVVAPIIN
ncbi:unnamed protein product [Caenorhabditis sp. 36 PRJEB53466]|nr:unnamed protein product [Caenorhabditis sp. 36 PRJEB53466]